MRGQRNRQWKLLMAGIAVFVAAQTLVPSASVQAQEKKKGLVDQLSGQGYGMAGCGLGSILFGERTGIIQVFAATTNDFYSNNTFAVSSGTSNCEPDMGSASSAKNFIDSNRPAIENDIARGSGETLSAFYEVAGCQERSAVATTLKSNYKNIFAPGANNEQVYRSIRETLTNEKSTAHSCSKLG